VAASNYDSLEVPMKTVLLMTSLAAVALSAWLWSQLRAGHDSFNSYIVSQHSSQLLDAQRLEDLLRAGRVSDALAHLQNRRDGTVVALNWAVSATTPPNWRWPHNAATLARAGEAFRDELAYRGAVGESSGRLGSQAAAVLADHR
jgi:hypothetical protein